MQTLTIYLDEDDARAIHAAAVLRQSMRVDGECAIPESDSDIMGTILGEICRDWVKSHERPNLRQ